MVDYTKKELRDESWLRWKGGSKLASELRNFYTAKSVFARLGEKVPLASKSGTWSSGDEAYDAAVKRAARLSPRMRERALRKLRNQRLRAQMDAGELDQKMPVGRAQRPSGRRGDPGFVR